MNINEQTIDKLSIAFSEDLMTDLGEETLREIARRNYDETDENVCHSHDFCDANIVMHGAFEASFDREPDLQNETDVMLINMAWSLAKDYNFGIEL